jgi:DNA-directed RNA polymerase specialized sigma24 family protein
VSKCKENTKRLEVLFRNHNKWLMACAFNVAKNKDIAEELVSELYLYLGERCNPQLYYLDSFNLQYCYAFLKTRFINRIKADKRVTKLADDYDIEEKEYDYDTDQKLEGAHDGIIDELKRLEGVPKIWASSKIYQMYTFDKEMTYEKLSEEIDISKSTAYLHCKKIRKHLKETLPNPFKTSPD